MEALLRLLVIALASLAVLAFSNWRHRRKRARVEAELARRWAERDLAKGTPNQTTKGGEEER